MRDPLEYAIYSGAIAALRRRAEAQRETASAGIGSVIHNEKPITVVTSEASAALKIAVDLESIAAELEAGARS